MKNERTAPVELSVDDLGSVAGGLDEFARRPVTGLSAAWNSSWHPDGSGGAGAGVSDMFGVLGVGGPAGVGHASNNGGGAGTAGGVLGGGAGAHSISTLPLGQLAPVAGWGSGPVGSGTAINGGGGAGSSAFVDPNGSPLAGIGGAGYPGGPGGVGGMGYPNGIVPAGAGVNGIVGPNGYSPMTAPFAGANGSPLGGPAGIGTGNPGDVSPLGGLGANSHFTPGWGNANGGPLGGGAGAFGPNGAGGLGVGGPNGYGGGGAGIVTNSFEIKSWGDPHLNITVNGEAMGQMDRAASIDNFAVLNNTAGGATAISTVTTNQEVNSVSYNKEIDIVGGNGQWHLEATNADMDNDVDVVIQDVNGTHAIAEGQSVRNADGTVITNTGDKLLVTQQLAGGGNVTTEVTINGANYLDMKTTGQGNAGLGGFAAEQFAKDHQVQANIPLVPVGSILTGVQGYGAQPAYGAQTYAPSAPLPAFPMPNGYR